MLIPYIQAAMGRAQYKIIEDDEPYFGEISSCLGVWAVGKALEACRKEVNVS